MVSTPADRITLTRRAAESAKKNLDLVVDLYRRGKVDIVRLVDAQTRSLVSNLGAANAVYDYVLSLLFVNREISYFRNLDTPEAETPKPVDAVFANTGPNKLYVNSGGGVFQDRIFEKIKDLNL